MLKFLLLLILLPACATESRLGTIEEQYVQYVNEYVRLAGINGIFVRTDKLTVISEENLPDQLNGLLLGTCTATVDWQVVRIRPSFWEFASPYDREELMFHELTHCLQFKMHDNDVELAWDWYSGNITMISVQSSVMNAIHFDGTFYGMNREVYIKRLFGKGWEEKLYYNSPVQNLPY